MVSAIELHTRYSPRTVVVIVGLQVAYCSLPRVRQNVGCQNVAYAETTTLKKNNNDFSNYWLYRTIKTYKTINVLKRNEYLPLNLLSVKLHCSSYVTDK